ncbi:MAG: 3-isopropylmalate dehydrogenase [Deltaproteobacteria bacterium]|nr:3-isopropylmalate dehydrogenase [Deltaproteobacteria bacterium]MBI3388635.1 3-isopropylmalate dehydrogenase [Deltaproteobacteria bacterium]
MTANVCVLPGDGIGPEVITEAVAVLQDCAQRFNFSVACAEAMFGGCAIDAHGIALPEVTRALATASDAVLLGAVGGPKWDNPNATVRPEQGLLGLRKELGVFANLRPVTVFPELLEAAPLKTDLLRGVDLVVVRELTGGIYFGKPSERRQTSNGREAIDTLIYTEGEIARLMRSAFELARTRRKKVTSVDKANVMSSSRLWREVAHEVAKEYPDVAYEDVLVDAMAMHLLKRPRDFDVIATENLFGDILTDEASMLAGSLGLLPSASLGEARNQLGQPRGLYEPIHGSAPDIAGQGKANPLAAILSVAMMLRYSLAQPQAAAAIETAVAGVLHAGYRTPDIMAAGGRAVNTSAMGAAVREHLAP